MRPGVHGIGRQRRVRRLGCFHSRGSYTVLGNEERGGDGRRFSEPRAVDSTAWCGGSMSRPVVWWTDPAGATEVREKTRATSPTARDVLLGTSFSSFFKCFKMFCAECVKNANTQGKVGLAAHKRCSHHEESTGGARGLPRTGNTPVGADACRRPGPGGGETAPRRSLRGVLEAVVGERRVADGPRGAKRPCARQGSRQCVPGGCRPNPRVVGLRGYTFFLRLFAPLPLGELMLFGGKLRSPAEACW